jgi:hypothetical protein
VAILNLKTIDFPYIKNVRYINTPNEGIAKSNRRTGEVIINRYYFDRLKEAHQYFVLEHESGHIKYETRDEFKADRYAMERYIATGHDVREGVKALTEHLNRNNPVHVLRAWKVYQQALNKDYAYSTNKPVKQAIADYKDRYDNIKNKLP